ncbi:MAG: hypothetical protein J5J00_14735 [Deltaproteobacteria bacterium]|nr:hypothetical protein [Deltaproteobacteria bacterium]
MKGWIRARSLRRQKGSQFIEYSLLLSLVAVVCIAGVNAVSHGTRRTFCAVLLEKTKEEITSDNYTADGHCKTDASSPGGVTQYF